MRQLETLIGEDNLREGLREYLRRFAFANATWPDLIAILDARSDEDLAGWSAVWVEEPGRPTVRADWATDGPGELSSLVMRQFDPAEAGRVWSQRLNVRISHPEGSDLLPVLLDAAEYPVEVVRGRPAPEYVLPNGGGEGYGLFMLDSVSQRVLLRRTPELESGLTRGIAWLTLWDAMLERLVPPSRIIDLAAATLVGEKDELIVERVLSYLEEAYWRYSTDDDRAERAVSLEALLWRRLRDAPTSSLKSAYFDTYVSLALSDRAVQRLERIWRGDLSIEGLTLSENDHIRLARELAVREIDGWDAVLDAQQARIENPDREAEFRFVRPALSADPAVRDSFFASLSAPENRDHEPWVLDAVSYLHHPLRARHSRAYIRPSLELLEEIQATGDIFFPKRWLDATLSGHNTAKAAEIVRDFLAAHPDYPARLRGKILQSADPVFRAAAIVGAGSGELAVQSR
ncbi:MAG: hypothetical protein GWN99_19460 [Gemmatimonadetes bacterium]|uniref:Aminopeptidase N n=1 Tax=Candidatus Kutchimonas denitrificans TaxID=3056748 RepID=A0AAE5CBX1_9BACT|nr:hypothetical protein [Gemmatimonadota bacterium]NIR76397.1 hypothetical protein [Candidatus Kutchimonas denitrificans]NIS03207.1 hypothetical protein [Gemmatimonadota bacterium]NIT66380.1 hypothetical protein [Gemmatimonadota bacterium]NIU54459.1 hypothetical protein [Gemmatimonadota bacterium]